MDIYASEEEQVQAIKKWGKENGPGIIAGLILGLGALFGWRYWQGQQLDEADRASTGFQEMQSLLFEEHFANAMDVGQRLKSQHPEHNYAMFAALTVARLQIDSGNIDSAVRELQWVIDNTKTAGITALAERRLGEIYLSQGKPDQAWAMVEPIATTPAQASLHELRGDIALAQGKPDQAKEEYVRALAIAEESQQSLNVIQLKLDDLGSYQSEQADIIKAQLPRSDVAESDVPTSDDPASDSQ